MLEVLDGMVNARWDWIQTLQVIAKDSLYQNKVGGLRKERSGTQTKVSTKHMVDALKDSGSLLLCALEWCNSKASMAKLERT